MLVWHQNRETRLLSLGAGNGRHFLNLNVHIFLIGGRVAEVILQTAFFGVEAGFLLSQTGWEETLCLCCLIKKISAATG